MDTAEGIFNFVVVKGSVVAYRHYFKLVVCVVDCIVGSENIAMVVHRHN